MQKENHFCPVVDGNLATSGCGRASCLYFDKEGGACRFSKVTAVQQAEYRKPADRMAAFCTLYDVTPVEIQEASDRIRLILCANQYFKYLFDCSLLDVKTSDVTVFLSSELRYASWNFHGGKPTFEELRALVLTVLPLL